MQIIKQEQASIESISSLIQGRLFYPCLKLAI